MLFKKKITNLKIIEQLLEPLMDSIGDWDAPLLVSSNRVCFKTPCNMIIVASRETDNSSNINFLFKRNEGEQHVSLENYRSPQDVSPDWRSEAFSPLERFIAKWREEAHNRNLREAEILEENHRFFHDFVDFLHIHDLEGPSIHKIRLSTEGHFGVSAYSYHYLSPKTLQRALRILRRHQDEFDGD